jgi:hypothetical protein
LYSLYSFPGVCTFQPLHHPPLLCHIYPSHPHIPHIFFLNPPFVTNSLYPMYLVLSSSTSRECRGLSLELDCTVAISFHELVLYRVTVVVGSSLSIHSNAKRRSGCEMRVNRPSSFLCFHFHFHPLLAQTLRCVGGILLIVIRCSNNM